MLEVLASVTCQKSYLNIFIPYCPPEQHLVWVCAGDGRKLPRYLNVSPCKWFRFYCSNAHAKGCHLPESCSQSEDNTPMCCPDQLRLPRTCTLRRALAWVHTHTHTCCVPPQSHYPSAAVAFFPGLPLSEVRPTAQLASGATGCVQWGGIGVWLSETHVSAMSALLPQAWAGLRKDCWVWWVSQATFWSFNFFFFFFLLEDKCLFPSSHEATAFGNKGAWCVHGRTYCWWWRWFLPPEGWGLGPGWPARLPQSGQQGPKWPSSRLRSCRLRLWSGWWAGLPEIPRSRWARRPGSRRWADRSRKRPVLSVRHQVRDEMSTASIFCPAAN